MTVIVVLGILAGGGLCLAYSALVPARPTLATLIAGVNTVAPPPTTVVSGPARLAAPTAASLHRRGLPRPGILADLAICDLDPIGYLSSQTLAAFVGGLAPAVAGGVISALLGGGWLLPLWLGLLGAAVLPLLRRARLRAQAAARRTELRAALSVMLDLTVVALSGGAGVEQALQIATSPRLGDGWAMRQLRGAVLAAQHAGVTSWTNFADLGTRLRVSQLTDLAAAVALTGSEGAHLRDSLAARAVTLRGRQAAALKATARAATQQMVMPLMVIGCGYVVFLLYPAVHIMLTVL